MDFITGLPNSKGYTIVLVVVDRLSKYAHFIPMKSDYTAKVVAEAFFHNVVKLHGVPKSIVSDRDKVFTSNFWQHLFKLQGTSLAMSSAYHRQSDGQTEAVNKVLEMFLRCYTYDHPKLWHKALTWAELWYNTSYHTSAGMTPFVVVYGRQPPSIVKYLVNSDDPPQVQELLRDRDQILQQLKANLDKAQNRMKNQADKHRVDKEFQEGDLVLVKLQPYKQHSIQLRKNQKLSLRYFGPFPIMQKIGKVAYKLELPSDAKIHPVFHISMLKAFNGDPALQYLPLPMLTAAQGPILQPYALLDSRVVKSAGTESVQLLVQWEGMTPKEATWEEYDTIAQHYPFFNLEDKVVFKEGGIVMMPKVNKDVLEKDTRHEVVELVTGHNHVAEGEDSKLRGRGHREKVRNNRLKDYVT